MKKDEFKKEIEVFKKERTEKRVAKINEIIGSMKSDAKKSREIMKLLIKEYIYVRDSYINKFRASGVKVTINPESKDVKPELENGDKEGTEDNEFIKIYAYSFGPFNVYNFSKDNTLRIVWLLKEPLLKDIEQMRGKDEGPNQAADFYNWAKINEDEINEDGKRIDGTKKKLIKYSLRLLQKLQKELSNEDIERISDENIKKRLRQLKQENLRVSDKKFEADDIYNTVMSHICIIEVNHFPGLALKEWSSDDDIIGIWGEINAELLGKLLEFYKPDIICGGNVLRHFTFDSDTNNPVEDRNYDKINDIAELTIKFGSLPLPVVERNVEQGKNYIYRVNGDRPVYLIDADHPFYQYFNPAVALEDVESILNDKDL